MMINLLSGSKNAKGLMANKGNLSNNSIIILLLIALIVSQIVTFFRLKEFQEAIIYQNKTIIGQELVIQKIVSSQESLFEMQRLQSEINILQFKKSEKPSWNLQEI